MLKIKNASREREAETYMPYVGHVAPDVVLLENGTLLAMVAVRGAEFETSDVAVINGQLAQRNAALMNVAKPGLMLASHLIRTMADGSAYPKAECETEFGRQLDAAYKAKLLDNRLYRNDLYLSVMVRPTLGANDNFLSALLGGLKKDGQARVADPALLRTLTETTDSLLASLSDYGMRRLGLREEKGVAFSEIGEVLRLILMGDRLKVPLVDGHLGAAIYTNRVIIGRETVEIRRDGGSTFAAMFGMREYPSSTRPGVFDGLLSAPYRLCLTQTYGCIVKGDALDNMSKKGRQMGSAGDRATSQREALAEAADMVQANRMQMGDHHLSLIAYADKIDRVPAVAARAKADLADAGAIIAREDLGLEAAFWAQMPGNVKARTRPGAISSRNFAAMGAFHNYPAGDGKGHWGSPIALVRTSGGTGYGLHFHPPGSQAPDLGNVFISGPSGSGKTTAMGAMLAFAERVGAWRVIFDKDRGCEILVRASGGAYLVLPTGEPTGLAPLKALERTEENLGFLKSLIAGLIGGELEPEQDRLLTMAIETVMALPPELRGLGEVRAFLLKTDPSGPGARLEKWCKGGSLGWVIDNDRDDLDMTAKFIGFDMTKVLDDPETRGPIMSYLFHRVEQMLDGRRLILAIDEFWKALLDPAFRDVVNDKLKTIRKLNGAVILATQSPSDALKSPIAHSIIQQCPTQILFPDGRGDEAVYMEGLKLTQAQFDAVTGGLTAGGARRFLVNVPGKESVAAELDLSGMDDQIAVLSGRASTVRLMERLIAQHGPAPSDWLHHFQAQWRNATA